VVDEEEEVISASIALDPLGVEEWRALLLWLLPLALLVPNSVEE